ncbi:(4Fe-4S)-binding protein [Streptomyces sp. NPDC050400]|uniref:(4Fe-4S)-binding protein n=1 Tax=Streptomyces sp. NPDC050400 TaxID=3365610 RepID=UPI0037AA3664
MTRKPYPGNLVTVTFDGQRCLHAAECVRGLPQVFDTERRPWIQPDAAPADEVAAVVRRCPSGALRYELLDGTVEVPPAATTIERTPDGRLVMRGDLRIRTADGSRAVEVRATLCGCGVSGNQPYCDHAGACGQDGQDGKDGKAGEG